MNTLSQKKELIKWISSLEDPDIINQINQFKNEVSINFNEELKRAITGNELKTRTSKFLSNLEWKP